MDNNKMGQLVEAFCKKNDIKMGGNFLHFLVQAGKTASALHLKEEAVIEAVQAIVGKGVNTMYICPNCESNVLVEYGSCPTCGTELVEGGNEKVEVKEVKLPTTKAKAKDDGDVIREKIAQRPKLVVPPQPEDIKKMKRPELEFVIQSFNLDIDIEGKLPDIRKAIIEEIYPQESATIKDIKTKKDIKIENVDEDEEIEDDEFEEEVDEDDVDESDDEEEEEEKPVKKASKKASKKVVEEEEEDEEIEEDEDESDEDDLEEEEDEDDEPVKKPAKKTAKKVVEEDEDEEELDEDEFEEEEDESEDEEEDDLDDDHDPDLHSHGNEADDEEEEEDSDDEDEEDDEEEEEKPVKKASKKTAKKVVEEDDEEEEEDEPVKKAPKKAPATLEDAKALRVKAKAKVKEMIVDFKANPKLVDKAEQKDLILVLGALGLKENLMKLDKKALAQKVKDTIKAKK